MSQPQSQQLGLAVFRSLVGQAAKMAAGLVPGGTVVYDLVKGVYDEVEKSEYVTHNQLQAALLALTDEDRTRLREEALAGSHLLTLDQQRRLRATMAAAEQQLFTQLLAEAEHREALAAQAEANATVQRLRITLARQLQKSRYPAALKTANRLAIFTPYDADLLRTQRQLEEKLSKTLLKALLGALVCGFVGGAVVGWLWAVNDWNNNSPTVCTVPALYPAYPGQCLMFGHPEFPMSAYLGRIALIALAGAVLLVVIGCAVEGPRRWRRDQILRRNGL